MLKKHLNTLITLFFLLIFSGASYAQTETKDSVALRDFLSELESKFDVKFSYADTDVDTVYITKPTSNVLNDILNELGDITGITINKLNDRYYTLTKTTTISICGYVLDNFEENNIPGATVEIYESNLSGVTDENGSFNFENVPINSLVYIKHLGYRPIFIEAKVLLKTNECKTIAMALSYQELDEVIVTQFLTTGLYKLNNAGFELSPSKFGILPGVSEPDILQTVQALPGIKSVDETVSDINIRGGTNDQNLILWDGIKMYQTGHFFGLISAFNPYVTEKVTIIKNGTSAMYSGGVSGTLSMRTSEELPLNFNGGSGFNLISGDVFGEIPIQNNMALQVSARRSYTDFLNTPTYTTFSEKAFQDTEVNSESEFYFYDFTTKFMYEINPYQKASVSLINMSNNLNYLETANDSLAPNRSNLNQDNFSIGSELQSEWTDYFSSQLSFYYTQYDLDALSISNNDAQQLEQNNLVKESNIKLTTNYKLRENLVWMNGYEFTETGIENTTNVNQPPFTSNIKGVIRKHGLFSEIAYSSEDEKLNGFIGGRVNYIENLDTFQEYIFEPRINISYELLSNFKVEVLGEYKSQVTNQIIDLEQNFLGIEKRRWILSDGDALPITKSKQGSFGFNFDTNRLYVGIDAFYKEVNGINVYTQGFQNQNQFDGEIGSYAVKGAEFLINTKNNDYSAWLSYTFNKNDYTFDVLEPSTFPNNLDVRHAITLAGNYTLGDLKIGMGINYKSGKPFTRPDENEPINETVFPTEINYEDPNSSRLPEYFRADASANYTLKMGDTMNAIFGVSVLNFTNRRNTLNTYYRLQNDNTIETIERLSLGITPNASVRINF
ncbi:TonB-dependent receptor [Maribacter hydrothermalis]|uniref:TonB-dependent receptor n=1 Tax=Maribacter hydrothermalis TaxID=1836467 RepID=A0A1B7ZCM5_9FLAO|nr:carboxypeptidase-like regulatory domain-containing protein [Maribacter hydrothermalis]APQ17983.1 TonB-dependent receptor [Maribacter hydrothermalis]OBR40523.1 TonB-dependent receptor [Maribacter hydrothermalis]